MLASNNVHCSPWLEERVKVVTTEVVSLGRYVDMEEVPAEGGDLFSLGCNNGLLVGITASWVVVV
jgi:hypothetical protein